MLFRAKDEELNNSLADRTNARKTIFVSGTMYGGRKAVRIAVAGWDIDYSSAAEGDAAIVCGVLDKVLEEWESEKTPTPTQTQHEKIGMLKQDEVEVTHEEVTRGSSSHSARSVSSTESEGTRLWKQQMEEVGGKLDADMEKVAPAWEIGNSMPCRSTSTDEQPDPLHEVRNAQHAPAQEGRRPSIVYVGDVAQGGLSGHGTAVPNSEAAQMRRAFDLGVSSFLEEDVGLDGGLEPRRGESSIDSLSSVSRCERQRERERVLPTRGINSPHAVHAARTPVQPHSPLVSAEEWEEERGELDQVDGADDEPSILILTERSRVSGVLEPKYHEYVPKMRERKESSLRTPGSWESRHLEDTMSSLGDQGNDTPHAPHTLDALD